MNIARVIVLAHNSNGQPEFHTYWVEATQADQDAGTHYNHAKRSAAAHGYVEPMIAFDSTDPAACQLPRLHTWMIEPPLLFT